MTHLANEWSSLSQLQPRDYICGHCGKGIGPDKGYCHQRMAWTIYICTFCAKPTIFLNVDQFPGVPFGQQVEHVPKDIQILYDEARRCMSVNAFTSKVLLSRKILMHLAVERGAKVGESFIFYVEYLAEKGYVPPDGKLWVDHIRINGNDANHEIKVFTKEEGELLLTFLEMLLKFIYEFHKKLPVSKKP